MPAPNPCWLFVMVVFLCSVVRGKWARAAFPHPLVCARKHGSSGRSRNGSQPDPVAKGLSRRRPLSLRSTNILCQPLNDPFLSFAQFRHVENEAILLQSADSSFGLLIRSSFGLLIRVGSSPHPLILWSGSGVSDPSIPSQRRCSRRPLRGETKSNEFNEAFLEWYPSLGWFGKFPLHSIAWWSHSPMPDQCSVPIPTFRLTMDSQVRVR